MKTAKPQRVSTKQQDTTLTAILFDGQRLFYAVLFGVAAGTTVYICGRIITNFL